MQVPAGAGEEFFSFACLLPAPLRVASAKAENCSFKAWGFSPVILLFFLIQTSGKRGAGETCFDGVLHKLRDDFFRFQCADLLAERSNLRF